MDVMQFAGTDQALDDAQVFRAQFGPTEHPVFLAHGDGSGKASSSPVKALFYLLKHSAYLGGALGKYAGSLSADTFIGD